MPRHDDEQPVTMRAPPRVWLLFGARAGDNSQVLALGELLGWPFEIRQIVFGRRLLPKPLAVRSQNLRVAGIDLRRSTPLVSPWPELVILSGREQEPVARWIRRAAGGGVRLVYMGRPWAPLDTYDLIITTPQYFLPERPNVVLNLLPLHRVTAERLASEGAIWEARLRHLPRPYTAVLLGGSSGTFTFTPAKACELAARVGALVRVHGGSLLITDSARTPAAVFGAFIAGIDAPSHVYRWGSRDAENPFFGYLALADRIVTTGESVSMLAESCATGKPVHVFDLSDALPRSAPWHQRFVARFGYPALRDWVGRSVGPGYMQRDIGRIQQLLVAGGRAQWLGERAPETGNDHDTRVPRDTAEAVERVRALFAGERRR
ncbi:MAG: hypothetical protein CALGDGBN_01796 [Pseudomonadales bacterium]|nr:hypothetical protein [Pseudomonadales bacterium]